MRLHACSTYPTATTATAKYHPTQPNPTSKPKQQKTPPKNNPQREDQQTTQAPSVILCAIRAPYSTECRNLLPPPRFLKKNNIHLLFLSSGSATFGRAMKTKTKTKCTRMPPHPTPSHDMTWHPNPSHHLSLVLIVIILEHRPADRPQPTLGPEAERFVRELLERERRLVHPIPQLGPPFRPLTRLQLFGTLKKTDEYRRLRTHTAATWRRGV